MFLFDGYCIYYENDADNDYDKNYYVERYDFYNDGNQCVDKDDYANRDNIYDVVMRYLL